MSLNLKLPVALRNIIADTITTRAGNAALLRIYDGTQAASADTAVGAQVLLAELVCGTPFAPSASSGVLTLGAITQDSSANASGTASWFRLVKADGSTVVYDGSVGVSGCDLNLVTVTIVATQPVLVTSFTLAPGGA